MPWTNRETPPTNGINVLCEGANKEIKRVRYEIDGIYDAVTDNIDPGLGIPLRWRELTTDEEVQLERDRVEYRR